MRFVASADWHLGKQAGFLKDEERPRYVQARDDVIVRMGELARKVGADFIVVGGDVYESNQVDRSVINRSLEAMGRAAVPIYLLPGNHDPLGPGSIYDSKSFASRTQGNVRVLRDTGVAAKLSARDGCEVQILAAPWKSKDPRKDLLGEMLDAFSASPESERQGRQVRVVVGHGNVSTLQADRNSKNAIDVQKVSGYLQRDLIDFVVVGDRHGTYEVATDFWYPGTPEVTAEREVDPGNVLVVDIDPDTRAVKVEKHRVGVWSFEVRDFDLNGEEDIRVLEADLEAYPNKRTTSVKLVLRGTLTPGQMADLENRLDRLRDLFARLEYWDRHYDLAIRAEDGDFSDLGLSGFAREALRDLASRASEDADKDEASGGGDKNESQGADVDKKAAASEALSLLYRLAGGSR